MLEYLIEALGFSTSNLNLSQYVLCLLTIYFSATLWNKRTTLGKNISLLEKLPGPKKYPIFGSTIGHEMRYMIFNPTKMLIDFLEGLTKTYGKVLCLWIMNEPKVIMSDLKLVTKLLKEDYLVAKSTEVSKLAKAVGGGGIIALTADVHPHRKRQWMPAFNRKQVEYSIPFFVQEALRLCEELSKYQNTGNTFDLLPMSIGCTFRAICHTVFGKEFMSKLSHEAAYNHMHDFHTISKNMTTRFLQPWLENDLVYFNATSKGRETKKCIKRANNLTRQAVCERRLQRILKPECEATEEDFECFLDRMVKLLENGELAEWEVVQELNIFIAAGYDTSGITICYVFYFLSLYPEHQERIVKELCDAIPTEYWNSVTNYSITTQLTQQMKYLELCIKETLRLYPIAPMYLRRTAQDVNLPDGRIIPKDTDVYVMVNRIQRDPEYFPEPEKFIPERHLQPSPAFMPFALGSRSCIGQTYAMFEMKVILAYLLMEYKWETIESPNFKPIYQGLWVPENGLHFKITKRVF